VALIQLFFQISRDLGQTGVVKACFQVPPENRGTNFAVKFTPHFGTLARPKKNVASQTKSMIFGQSEMEMVIESDDGIVVAVFYGQRCQKVTAERLAHDLLEKFCETFPHEIRRLRQDYSKNNQAHATKGAENGTGGNGVISGDDMLGDSSPTMGTNINNTTETDVGVDESEKEEDPEELRIRKQERVMTVYHRRFEDMVSQLISKNTKQRKR